MLRTAETSDSPAAAPGRSDRSPGGPARLTAQRGLFFGPTGRAPEDLYSVVERGVARRERGRITLAPGSRVGTNTYFGRFYATYWQRWTSVEQVEVTAVASGEGRVRLLASDTNKVSRIVDSVDVGTSAGPETREIRLVGPIDRFLDGGGMWLEITTELGQLSVSDVRWTVLAPRAVPTTDVVICTYNRVEECLDTLQAMIDDPEALAVVGLVRVVDQGSDPLESRERFEAVSKELGDKLVYLRQPNLGGAGGFTRGLFEATAGPVEEQRDVLFMDDDVMLEPELLFRLTTFGACTAQPTIVGGQMLNLLHPGHLHISAEYADPENLLVGIPVEGALQEAYLLGKDERDLPINQERRADTEYNGWWSCLIPAAIVRAIGYPLPLFFQWDDIEFGYRARHAGFPTVSLPGAGVWHGDFGWKDWDEWHRYFNLRNGLITAALRTPFSTRTINKRIAHLLSIYLVGMHYGLAATLLQAVEDFLDGPEILADGSAEAATKIRRIRSDFPETKVVPMSDLPDEFTDLTVVRSGPDPSLEGLTLAKRAAYHLLGKAVHRTGFIPAGDAHWWHVALFDRAVVTDMGETGVRVRKRDKDLALALGRRGLEAMRRLKAEGPAVRDQYRAAVPELTSRENWARLYGLD
ncbi:glycosyltransferase [Pseudonocardia oroxyli]|uniref:Galactofuranosylgalactofuranosylrhamnosyl-N-acetylglucosaminyl-diphospho-decaprenol beta-1,5/1,6-galactofuranosyltransferase n=1 Tax=Pseudonocardia oroxyli TaxID=366584 RepID=A0A1G7M5H2_PSEOR|nr:glycosyltransferase [Pseudonocardia oroxyli]SDF56914.1 galactofuranosylgalactofuranosylrhamnosyl-N-acetylglucosaminyl-diphospho-decaprenol beta-1,5/1,6-galactofuranosyltransferase [Pseudonocardia oroxyli]